MDLVEELNGLAFSALSVRSWKLSNVSRSSDVRVLFRASEGPVAFAVVSTRQSTLSPRGGLWPVLLVGKSTKKACAPAVGTLIGCW
jgi:hypothetical protein